MKMILKGVKCPYCKGPVDAFVRRVRDPHSPDGWSWARTMRSFRLPYPIAPCDRKVSRTVMTGPGRGESVTEWEHVWAGHCKACSCGLSEQELERGEPLRPAASGMAAGWAAAMLPEPALPADTPSQSGAAADKH